MEIQTLVGYLDNPTNASPWLVDLGFADPERAHANLVHLAREGITIDLLATISRQMSELAPQLSDPDMALNNLERFIAAARNPLSWGSLFERDPESLRILLQLLSHSQYLSEILIRHPESFDIVRLTGGTPVAREFLVKEICSEVENLADERHVMNTLRRYKQRETLRIAYGDIVRGQPLRATTEQIAFLADAIVEAALAAARRKLRAKWGDPIRSDGQPSRFVVLAMGKHGGEELNYSSDIDLIYISDDNGSTNGDRSVTNMEYYARLAQEINRLLTEPTELGVAYRVDLRLRPQGTQGPAVTQFEAACNYYDRQGRTWERQAFVKARAAAGDLDLGHEFLERMEPWVYRQYLNRADITGIKALKRRIEQRAIREEGGTYNVKLGPGGIRDIEFVIQFLQLLNGGDLPEIRTGNTLAAIARLEEAGCLTQQERSILEQNYVFLRNVEHRLQIMFDLQTHEISHDETEQVKLAKRMGFAGTPHRSARDAFMSEYERVTKLDQQIIDHLLHDAFPDEEEQQPEFDLVLDPDPDQRQIEEVIGRYRFEDIASAYSNLSALSVERIPFLSTRRCRHFLASISPKLLSAISATPKPDATLTNLSRVSDSLGGKGVLWELFSFNPATLDLYVRMCAVSPYLSGILTSNPGMVDELMDSLMLDRLPGLDLLRSSLADLFRGAQDIDPILHSFKNSHHLTVGVRDILGKNDVKELHRALSDIAQVCTEAVAAREFHRLAERYGVPHSEHATAEDGRCEFVIVAMGKMGGREPNYHSDLDVVFLYEGEGQTQHPPNRGRSAEITTNGHFFSQLGQKIIKVFTQLGPYGRLYEMDPRLRPTGKSGPLSVSFETLTNYFESGQGQLWERQAFLKARPISGSEAARQAAMEQIRQAIVAPGWKDSDAAAIRDMRMRMEETASPRNLKRGPGGTVDIEFTVQMLQLRHVAEHPEVLTPGTLDALDALQSCNAISPDDHEYFSQSYRLLRSIEAGVRLMNTTARHDLPEDAETLEMLAYLLRWDDPNKLAAQCSEYMTENRTRFDRFFGS